MTSKSGLHEAQSTQPILLLASRDVVTKAAELKPPLHQLACPTSLDQLNILQNQINPWLLPSTLQNLKGPVLTAAKDGIRALLKQCCFRANKF